MERVRARGQVSCLSCLRKLNTRGKLLVKWLEGNARMFVRFTTSEDSSDNVRKHVRSPSIVLSSTCNLKRGKTYDDVCIVLNGAKRSWRVCLRTHLFVLRFTQKFLSLFYAFYTLAVCRAFRRVYGNLKPLKLRLAPPWLRWIVSDSFARKCVIVGRDRW